VPAAFCACAVSEIVQSVPYKTAAPAVAEYGARDAMPHWFTSAVSKCNATDVPTAPPVAQVQQAEVSILETCINHSYDHTVDLGPVSQATDTLIRFSHTYSLDAQMGGHSDLKAHTLRQALADARDTLRDCSPQDASRLDTVLSAP
jgi:hypothetical protein